MSNDPKTPSAEAAKLAIQILGLSSNAVARLIDQHVRRQVEQLQAENATLLDWRRRASRLISDIREGINKWCKQRTMHHATFWQLAQDWHDRVPDEVGLRDDELGEHPGSALLEEMRQLREFRFVPDEQGGHIEFNGKVWRPAAEAAKEQVHGAAPSTP